MNRQKGFLLLAIAVALAFVGLMFAPYLAYILTGLLLAFLLQPLQRRLSKRIPASLSAGLIILTTFMFVLLPLAAVSGVLVQDASRLVSGLETQNTDVGEELDVFEAELESLTGQELDLRSSIRSGVISVGSTVANSASGVLSAASGVLVGLSVMIFIQFYGLRDGKRFVEWTKKIDLLPDRIQEELYAKTGATVRAVMKGNIVVAILQGVVAGIGLWIVGIGNVFFWTALMIILGFIPIVGSMFVWLPAAVYLLITGETNLALILIFWGFLLVGSVDNFMRPYLIDESAGLHPLFVLLGVIGGLSVFGAIGIFLGPVLISVAKNLLEIYITEYNQL